MGKIEIKNLNAGPNEGAKKKKKNKLGTADLIRQKRKDLHKPKLNLFNYKFNNKKYNIVGQKNVKGSKGAPLESRVKAFKKREQTLLKEYQNLNRSGRFEDNRIKAIKKKKQNIYNLDNDIEGFLDVKPQSVFSAQRLEESDSDDEYDELNSPANIEKLHFGGGSLNKKSDEPAKTKAELYSEIIVEAKKRKLEKQAEKEEMRLLSEKLNEDWKGGIRKLVMSEVAEPTDPDNEFCSIKKMMAESVPIPLPPEEPKDPAAKTIKVVKNDNKDDETPAIKSILKTESSEQPEPSKKKKGIQLIAPVLEKDLSLKKHKKNAKSGSAKYLEDINMLKQKARKEKKSAIRELRRDREFLAKVQHDEHMAADAERKSKVKRIMHDLATQEHEFKQFTKKVKL